MLDLRVMTLLKIRCLMQSQSILVTASALISQSTVSQSLSTYLLTGLTFMISILQEIEVRDSMTGIFAS